MRVYLRWRLLTDVAVACFVLQKMLRSGDSNRQLNEQLSRLQLAYSQLNVSNECITENFILYSLSFKSVTSFSVLIVCGFNIFATEFHCNTLLNAL